MTNRVVHEPPACFYCIKSEELIEHFLVHWQVQDIGAKVLEYWRMQKFNSPNYSPFLGELLDHEPKY